MKWKLGLLAVLLLCAVMLPLMAGAETQTGSCGANGDNLTWTLTDEGILTIFGNGRMQDYGTVSYSTQITGALWQDRPRQVIIQDGVTSIGNNAFFGCTDLTSVKIADSVTSIGSEVFFNCITLSEINLPDDITDIGQAAFYGCADLERIDLPQKLTGISAYTFDSCSSLKSITIPEGVTYIGNTAFARCSGLKTISIPASVNSFGTWLFAECTALESVTLPANKQSVSFDCFYGCTSLQEIIFSDEVMHLPAGILACGRQNNADWYLDTEGLMTIWGTGSMDNGGGYSPNWKSYKENIKQVFIQEGITDIGYEAFCDCPNLISITIPDTITQIGYQAFARSGITNISIPTGVTQISLQAFYYCRDLEAINVASDNQYYSSADGVLYNKQKTELICCPAGYIGDLSIPANVKRIGREAFAWCTKLTGVSIPDSVTSFEYGAFQYCSMLNQITIPDGLTSIGDSAFRDCVSLPSIIIPEGVTSIGSYAFSGCTNLTIASIPASVSSIGSGTFYNCTNLTSATISEGMTGISDSVFSNCTSLTSITIPDGLTSIGNYAFQNCTNLNSISFLDGITSIGSNSFYNCSAKLYAHFDSTGAKELSKAGYCFRVPDSNFDLKYLYNDGIITGIEINRVDQDITSFTIPDYVTAIGGSAFYNCIHLTSISIPNSVTSIGGSAFWNCPAIIYAHIGSDSAKALSRAGRSFREFYTSCDLIYLYANNEITGLEIRGANQELASIDIPDGVTSIGNQAFNSCTNLTNITIPSSVTSIGDAAFYDCTSLTEVSIPEGVTSIGGYTFYGCSGLTSIIIPNSVTSIGSWAFGSCNSLPSVEIPESVTSIGEYAFDHCIALDNVNIPSSITNISGAAFGDCHSLTSVIIPEGVESIGGWAFIDCHSLTSVTIPDSVISIGSWAFANCGALNEIHISSIESWLSIDYVDYGSHPNAANGGSVHLFIGDSEITTITIPASFTSICDYAFSTLESLTNVIIPDEVTSIGDYAFYNCTGLSSITLSDRITSIGENAFWHGTTINAPIGSNIAKMLSKSFHTFQDIMFPKLHLLYEFDENDQIIGLSVVGAEKDIEQAVIPDGVISISACAFQNCANLINIIIPDSVTSIGGDAFSSCPILTSITLPKDVTCIGNATFLECTSLTNVTIPNGVTSIGDAAFLHCTSLTSITIPDSVTSIGESAFSSCTSLTNIKIPAGVTSIGNNTFYDCTSLTSITIPDSVTSIGNQAFYYCSSLTSVTIPASVTSIGDLAFGQCHQLKEVTLPDNISDIAWDTFHRNPGSVTDTVLKAAMYTFTPNGGGTCTLTKYNGYDTDVIIPSTDSSGNTVTCIGAEAFAHCSLTSVSIPDSVTSIENNAFQDCYFDTIRFPSNLISIGDEAFYGHRSHYAIYSITLPDSIKTIGNRAFYGVKTYSVNVFLPAPTVSMGDDVFGDATIYCYRDTDTDYWATGCGYQVVYLDDVNIESIRSISFSQTHYSIKQGETVTLMPMVFPTVDEPTVIYESSEPLVASVENGVVTANKTGTATITASIDNVSASVTIDVYIPATSFDIPSEFWTLARDKAAVIPIYNVFPEGGIVILKCQSADSTITEINNYGDNYLYPYGKKPGDVVVTASLDNGFKRECLVHVCYPVSAISFENESNTASIGIPLQLTANVTMRTQSCLNHLVTFSSSDETVATVDENGLVTPLKAGTVTITAMADSGVTASCTVTVKGAIVLPDSLKLIEEEAFMGAAFEAVIIPDGCTSIGSRAFADCLNLVYVRIPASVTSIAEDAFEGCEQVVIERIEE